jgi:CBS domain-containing protein
MAENEQREAHGQKPTDKTADATRSAARTAGQPTRQGAEMTGQAMKTSAQQGANLTDQATRQFAENTAHQVSEMSRQMARVTQQTAEDLHALMALPNLATHGLQEMQQAATSFVNSVMQTNMRMSQELFRQINPGAIAGFRQRFVQEYLEGFMQSSAEALRASRRLTEQALRPIEERAQSASRAGQSPGQPHGNGRVSDVMNAQVEVANPGQSIQEAARLMADTDTGTLPVGENDRIVGMITDHDIAIRVTAEGRDPKQTKVREVMTADTKYVFEDEDLGHVARNMAQLKVRRLPVVSRQKRLVGIVSLGDLGAQRSAQTMNEITR